MKPTAKVTDTTTSSIYKVLIVCLLALLLATCDDDDKPATYKVTFDVDNGKPEIASQTVKSGEQAQQPKEKPTKADSVVIGWINTANNQPYDFSTPVTANLALKAVYAKIYKITFNTNGGKTINPVEVPQGGSVAPPVPPPTQAGKFFAGWYTDAAFTTRYDFSQQVTSSDTLYAQWSDYNIPDDKFRAYLKSRVASAFSGEQLQPEHPQVKALKTINVAGQGIVSVEGIQYFTGLNELDCSSNQLNVLDVSANTALKALSCQGNQLASLDMRSNKDLTTLEVSSNDKLARVFVHEDILCHQGLKGIFEANRLALEMRIESYKDDGKSGQSYDENAYAKACFETTPTYTVTFDADGGVPEAVSQTVKSGEQAQEPESHPTKTDSVFIHWINTATDQPYDFSSPVTANLILKAVYVKAYTVTFDTDGGAPAVETQTVASGNQAQEPMVKPTKGELALKNWINTANDQPYNFLKLVRSDLNLKAVYANVYTVRFETNGGSTIDDEKVVDGDTLLAPLPPSKTGEFFAGWYTEDTFTTPYNFKTTVTASITLYARWSSNNIPDDKFRGYLKGKVPNAFDGEQLKIEHQEVKALKTIDVAGQGILSLEGIQYFTGLTELKCNNNQLSSLNVSTNTALTQLECFSNQLSSLDISNNTALTELNCYANQLSSLNVSTNTALTQLECYANQLSSLDVSGATALEYLDCFANQLISLDVSNNTALTFLSFPSNQLISLDVSNNTALTELNCSFNQLSSLDVSNNKALTELSCQSNQLISLDVSNNTTLKELDCYSNQLSSLDVSKNTALTELNCYSNQLSSLNMPANKSLKELDIVPNDQLAKISVHESKLCDAGITFGSGVKGIFEANKGTLEMTIISYDDNGDETTYDEAAYEEACK